MELFNSYAAWMPANSDTTVVYVGLVSE